MSSPSERKASTTAQSHRHLSADSTSPHHTPVIVTASDSEHSTSADDDNDHPNSISATISRQTTAATTTAGDGNGEQQAKKRRHRHRPIPGPEYAKLIHAHSQRTVARSLYPGSNYLDLATWLVYTTNVNNPPSASAATTKSSDEHDVIVFHDLGLSCTTTNNSENEEQTRFISSHSPLSTLSSLPLPSSAGSGQLLFLRGIPSPNWLAEIGGAYLISHPHSSSFPYLHFPISMPTLEYPASPEAPPPLISLPFHTKPSPN